jgi:hypothetical protein
MKWMRRKQVRLNKNGKETHAWVEGGEVSCLKGDVSISTSQNRKKKNKAKRERREGRP